MSRAVQERVYPLGQCCTNRSLRHFIITLACLHYVLDMSIVIIITGLCRFLEISDSPASPDPSVTRPAFRGDVVLGASSALDCPPSRSSGSLVPSACTRLCPLPCRPVAVLCNALGSGSALPSFGNSFCGKGNGMLPPLCIGRC